jgi:hypothetical protein
LSQFEIRFEKPLFATLSALSAAYHPFGDFRYSQRTLTERSTLVILARGDDSTRGLGRVQNSGLTIRATRAA